MNWRQRVRIRTNGNATDKPYLIANSSEASNFALWPGADVLNRYLGQYLARYILVEGNGKSRAFGLSSFKNMRSFES